MAENSSAARGVPIAGEQRWRGDSLTGVAASPHATEGMRSERVLTSGLSTGIARWFSDLYVSPTPLRESSAVTRFPAAVLGAVVLVVGVSACGGSSHSSSASSGSAAPASSTSSSSPATSTSATSSSASSAPASGGASTLTQAADPSGSLKFVKSSLTAKAGKVTIKFTNASMLPHNFTIQQDTGGSVVGATPTFSGGGTKTLSVTLKPGTYTFYCSVDGHRAAGMQGTLTVK
jgi:plastocyanin